MTSRTAAVAFAVLLPGGVSAQDVAVTAGYQSATTTVARATALREAGRWDDAEALLMEQSLICGSEGAEACVLLMDYSLGYLYSLRGDAEPSRYEIYLQLAAERYSLVLREEGGHLPTLNNLALVNRKLGSDAFTDEFLAVALELDPGSAGWYLMLHGDVHRDEGNWPTAVRSYRRAADAMPGDETVRRRIATSYRYLPAERLVELDELVASWTARFPAAAAAGYQTMILRADALPAAMATSALEGWTVIQADGDRISEDAVWRLRTAGLEDAIEELAAFVADPDGVPPYGTWWSQNQLLEPLARVALSVGRRAARAGLPAEAERALRAGFEIAQAEGANAIQVQLGLARELASLYHRYPDLDASGETVEALLVDLFEGKRVAITDADDRAQELFHTTLGLIYAERGEWSDDIRGYQNADYQLGAAVDAARRQTEEDGVYRPVPELLSLRAGGVFEKYGADYTAGLYREAVAGFLDTDQFDRATEAIDGIREIQGGGAELRSLRRFVRSRAELKRAVEAGAQGDDPGVCAPAATDEQVGAIASSLDPSGTGFLERQSFKVHADCASFQTDAGRRMHAVRALDLVGATGVGLTGLSDIARVERLSGDLQQWVGLSPQQTRLDQGEPDHGDLAIPIQVAPQQLPQYLIVPAATIAVRDLFQGVDPLDPRLQLRMEGTEAILLNDNTELGRVRIDARLQRRRPIG